MSVLRIVLADDHPLLRAGVKALLDAEADLTVVGEAADGSVAMKLVAELAPAVLVLGVSLPGAGVAEVAERVRGSHPNVRVVALCENDNGGCFARMLAAGASGCVYARSAPTELVRAVRAVAGGHTYLDSAAVADGPGAVELSEREAEVVRRIALGYSNKEIATRLQVSVKTVETYKARSLEKLGLHGRVELVRYAISRGWLMGG